MLTVCEADIDKARALELGADDYITKPFSLLELFARVRAVLRRAKPQALGVEEFKAGNLYINFYTKEVYKGGKLIPLTPLEFEILSVLCKNKGKLIPYRSLISQVWRSEVDFMDEVNLRVHIYHLRKKLEDDPKSPKIIVSRRGYGYKFDTSVNT